MSALAGNAYLWVKAIHIIAVIAWMAGIFYLPRLFVYHADSAPGSEKSETFKVMERRLYSAIMTPAMITRGSRASLSRRPATSGLRRGSLRSSCSSPR